MKKKITTLLLCVAITMTLCAGCGQATQNTAETREQTGIFERTQDEAAANNEISTVYMTTDISPEGLQAVYEALEWSPTGKLAVKVATGEVAESNYLRAELIGELVKSLDGTIVECNTIFGSNRLETAMHYQVAEDHGFTTFADVDIMDENGTMELVVNEGEVLNGVNYVGASFANYDSMLVLTHYKGHGWAGFGGSIKNISIGLGAPKGKMWIHSGGTKTTGTLTGASAMQYSLSLGDDKTLDNFQMAMAEAGLSVSDALGNGKNIVYINVMNRLSVDCDCVENPAEPDIHDIGILASTDPVALDQACTDLIWKAEGNESFIAQIEKRHGFVSLEHAEEIGLGNREYVLVNLD